MISLEVNEQVQKRQLENLMRELNELLPYFNDEKVLNIFVLHTGRIKIEHFTDGEINTDIFFKKEKVLKIINFIAAMSDKSIDINGIPTLETIIPDYNFRLTAVISPWVKIPELTIRRPNPKIIPLEQWLNEGRISQDHYDLIIQHIRDKKNIAIGGSTGSGKTTFLNSCIDKIVDFFPDERYLVIEDTPELRCRAEDCTLLHIKKSQALQAVEFAMRWSMQRLIFGEVRNSAMFQALFEAWNTGHQGNLTTFHADTASSMLNRMKGWLTDEESKNNISKTVHLCIHLTHKKITEVLPTQTTEELSQTIEQMEARMSQYRGFYDFQEKLGTAASGSG